MTNDDMADVVTFVLVVVTHVNDNDRQSLMSSDTHCVLKRDSVFNWL